MFLIFVELVRSLHGRVLVMVALPSVQSKILAAAVPRRNQRRRISRAAPQGLPSQMGAEVIDVHLDPERSFRANLLGVSSERP